MKQFLFIPALALIAAGCGISNASNISPASGGNSGKTSPTTYSLAQVRQASKSQKCWSVINGKVYDLTNYINQHQGGAQAILSICGKDGTAAFTSQHGGDRRPAQELATMQIGTLQ